MTPSAKAFEAREAVRCGASEIDMVINIGALKSRDYALVEDDIRRVVQAARPAKVKVILETGALNSEEKIIGCTLSKIAGAHFVKTSTGFGPGGATAEDIALMRKLVGEEMGVKASGGVRTHEDAEKMRAAGADRIGASASVAIVGGADAPKQQAKGY
jgi:deoxyribose-phosphate aldolase